MEILLKAIGIGLLLIVLILVAYFIVLLIESIIKEMKK